MKKLNSSGFKQAEYKRNVWRVTPVQGTTLEEIMQPEYWSHVGMNLRAGDLIEILPEDHSWYAELIVKKADRLYANTVLKSFLPLVSVQTPAAAQSTAPSLKPDATDDGEESDDGEDGEDKTKTPPASVDYKIAWKGGAKYCIIRLSDGEKIVGGLENKDDAQKALAEYIAKAA